VLSSLESLQKLGVLAPIYYKEHLVRDILLQNLQEQASQQIASVPDDPAIQAAVRYIQQHGNEEISLQFLAAHIGFSPSQLTRKFRQAMGVTPNKYVNRIRLEKAALLLAETDYTLEKIAELSGYLNAFYLSRVFTKEMQISPSQYRKSLKV
jgi:transcriptional regulator GlxA family with amidase domain